MKTIRAALGLVLALAFLAVPAGAEEEAVPMVYPSVQTILLNGEPKELHAYARKDANGYLTNYVKIRDMAALLDLTTARFNVDWEDGAVSIHTGVAYSSPNGQEDRAPYEGEQPYVPATADTLLDGARTAIDAFVITDADGNGSTYYRLRDLGKALDFLVSWEGGDIGVLIDTSLPYRD